MNFESCVKNATNFTDMKRVANAYVIDYKFLNAEELAAAIIKTAPQYSNESNVAKALSAIELHQNKNMRVLSDIIIREILLNSDDFASPAVDTDSKVCKYEKNIVDTANETQLENEVENIGFYRYVVAAAWENNDDISPDEQNLINKIRNKTKVSLYQHYVLEAQMGKFPKFENNIHSREDIAEARKLLQLNGLLFAVKDGDGVVYDIIPAEIAQVIRNIFNIDIKRASYNVLLESKFVKSKSYLAGILDKAGVSYPKHPTVTQLKDLIVKNVPARNVLGGFSPNDGLDKTTLSDWCSFIGASSSGSKSDIIDRIIRYYDNIKQIVVSEDDEREIYYQFFNELANRDISTLRQQGIIVKDLEIEHKFEDATDYIFERIFKIKPLMMSGSEHPDGILSFNDKLVMWDNKSKEVPVSLSEHIKQFDRYITNSEKAVAIFIVIAPSFTDSSAKECIKYSMNSNTLMLLITAEELKAVAEKWKAKHENDSDVFPLGLFKQNGRFNADLIDI